MLDEEVLKFCRDNAISIEKFLKDNFEFVRQEPRKKGQKRHRIKHNEITNWPNVISVPIPFAHRYKELVLRGKLVIVVDEFGKFVVYINPRIITEVFQLTDLEVTLESYDSIPDGYLEDEKKENERKQIMDKIADIEENLRIIKHFKGDASLSYMRNIIEAVDTTKEMQRIRKVGS